MSRAIRIIRLLAIEGRHMNGCMADAASRNDGWRKMQQAKRLARRLGYDLRDLGVQL